MRASILVRQVLRDRFWKLGSFCNNIRCPPHARSGLAISLRHWSPACTIAPVMTGGITGGLTNSLERYMDLLSARQKLVASNIANADTPGYHTQDIDFQREFMSFVDGQGPETVEPAELAEKPDGNNVSIDREARLLAENAIRFNLATTLVRSQLKMVRTAIQEGRGA